MVGLEDVGAGEVGGGAGVGVGGVVGQDPGLLACPDGVAPEEEAGVAVLDQEDAGPEVLVVAVGVPGLITTAHITDGAIVIDVGTTRTDDGLRGDVDFDSIQGVARAATPVPGGVGPMTIACLLDNTVKAAEARA